MMRALIVDDEIHAREELEALLVETGDFIISGKCANALEAIQAIKKEKPDVLFLDVQMPVINGFELLSMIDEKLMPNVVFVTAYDEYALKAFEENTLDYLLKPVEKSSLAKTVWKLKRMLNGGEKPVYAGADIKKIPCVLFSKIKLINVFEVEYVRSNEAGVYVICQGGEFFTDLTLKVLEDRTDLIRCHKQFLVNIDRIDEIIFRENMLAEIKTKSGHRVPVSRRHLKILRERLNFRERKT
ncbi:MAG TPA: two-component system response regulator BtsR [Syntrophales bacterium]|nr:two-component system response regulator BtsR [Syntrophales bacterium]